MEFSTNKPFPNAGDRGSDTCQHQVKLEVFAGTTRALQCADCDAFLPAPRITLPDFDIHTNDDDCEVDPETDCCVGCAVLHGEPCEVCGGRGYHNRNCNPPIDNGGRYF